MYKQILGLGQKCPEGFTSKQIEELLKTSKQNAHKYIKRLVENSYIVPKAKGKPIFYVLTLKGADYLKSTQCSVRMNGAPDASRIHRIAVKLPIVSDRGLASFKEKGVLLNNWIAKYIKQDQRFPFECTSITKTTKNMIVKFRSREFAYGPEFEKAVNAWYNELLALSKEYLKYKQGISTGPGILSSVEFEERDPLLGRKLKRAGKKIAFKYSLGRPAMDLKGDVQWDRRGREKDAWGAIDWSPAGGYEPGHESNDLRFAINRNELGENVKRLLDNEPRLISGIEGAQRETALMNKALGDLNLVLGDFRQHMIGRVNS
jgi:DNA-binding MarR family transcriptional regulator